MSRTASCPLATIVQFKTRQTAKIAKPTPVPAKGYHHGLSTRQPCHTRRMRTYDQLRPDQLLQELQERNHLVQHEHALVIQSSRQALNRSRTLLTRREAATTQNWPWRGPWCGL